MTTSFTEIAIKCAKCQEPLVRVTTAESDRCYCLGCGAFNEYKKIVRNAPGLIGGVITKEEILNLREQLLVAKKQADNGV